MTDLAPAYARVLIIEDEEPIRSLLRASLEDAHCIVATAENGVEGFEAFEAFAPELVLVDAMMPLMDGFETCRSIRSTTHGMNLPILMITGFTDDDSVERAFEAGVSDFITKPIVLPVLEQRIRRLVEAYRSEQQLRVAKDELEARVRQRTEELRRLNERLIDELSQRKRIQEQLAHDVLHDALTGLTNRTLFLDRLAHALERSRRPNEAHCAALFLDLDRFKTINDSLGHLIGDRLLIEVARRMEHALRPGDTVARFGGDEFAILVEGADTWEEAAFVANRIQEELCTPFMLNGHTVVTSASIGIALLNNDYQTPEEVLRDADIAMYRAKAQGKARYAFFEPVMHTRALANLQLEVDLRHAVEHGEFMLHYQPILALSTGELLGVEALVRWDRPEFGIVSPGEFIKVAEETGLIVPLGEWVLLEACKQASVWHAEGFHTLFVSINLSSRQFHDPHLVDKIHRALDESRLPPQYLQLEITESSLIDDIESTLVCLENLKALGVHLSIDDFGTGYSSLHYLQRFPLTTLKIDRSFVRDITRNSSDVGIVSAIIAMAHRLNLKVVAEGVEFDDQETFLRPYECDAVQGYLYGHPVPADCLQQQLFKKTPLKVG